MTGVKQIICLANSRRRQGRCVAGKERCADRRLAWVRPVSYRPDEEISEIEYRYPDGSCPQLLDVIEVPVQRSHPHLFQSENWLIQAHGRWTRRRAAVWHHLPRLADDPPSLWVNGSSSRHGLNDRVARGETEQLHESLYLLHLSELRLDVSSPGAAHGIPMPRLQAGFTWRNEPYRLRVTDPDVEWSYLLRDDGSYQLGECYVRVSLSLPFEGHCYKLVAAIIRPELETP